MAPDECRIYVGNLPMDVQRKEINQLFSKYGQIRNIEVKTGSHPPAYAFVEFEDYRDARDAVTYRNGYSFANARLRVEPSNPNGRRGMGGGGGGGSRGAGPSPYGPSRRTDHRAIITGLPSSCSWQDLKDHMRRAGDVTFSQVMREGDEMVGVVDYANADDLYNALKRLDNSDFRNHSDTLRHQG
eukprot:CAMPEP_0175058478 /NCGR_PEP_ID=MMETSP0052_2-20121109/11869_1 /TAXON_ID=51329 ORGANISM="Polytomella parva, Strain SAG 63-3" /NCGR_SAMPLE_ID=MMETSP0052_2 /ASSEMBLY_ACC=CAM_ASM_000194 /LENGTH=184 /DNA_ID=CAMNT_0016323861 /DNA_START=474 /DNA_END=1027 /DNA_ORIENTATION=+